jgi:hypothetical protein
VLSQRNRRAMGSLGDFTYLFFKYLLKEVNYPVPVAFNTDRFDLK